MNTCQHCKRQEPNNYLCTDCTTQLADMLNEIPWLLQELDARIQKLDRISIGTIGRTRRPDQLNVMDFDAAEESRKVRKLLLHWVETIAERALGRKPPNLQTVATANLAQWLAANVHHIARLSLIRKGRHPLYDDIKRLVGETQQGGDLVTAINPVEKHLVGPCPTITGREHNGTPRQCGKTLFADTYDSTVTCPSCDQEIDVKKNRERAAAERDLHTKASLLEVLTNIDEAVPEQQIDRWIEARRLRPKGFIHDGVIVEYRLSESAEAVYSLERARKLRRRDNHLRTRTRAGA